MQVFISYSHADQDIAAKLRLSLEEEGLSFNDPDPNAGDSWRQQLEGAIRSSEAILLLLSSHPRLDEQQQLTWRLALEAVWADPAKRLVPILLQDAELPAFVRSGASGESVKAIRIREPRELMLAVQAILQILGVGSRHQDGKALAGATIGSLLLPYMVANAVDAVRRHVFGNVIVIESYPAVTEEDRVQRQERLSAIKQYAEQLKH